MTERWLPVRESGGRYDVSDLGRVRSNGWRLVTKDGRIRRVPPKILSGKPSHNAGYVMVNLRMPSGECAHVHVHALVLTTFVGPRPDGHEGCHNNGDPSDNRLANLRWDTPSGNRADKLTHHRDHNVNKTHCGACGLPYDDANTRRFGPDNRWRRCKNCERRYQRNRYHKKKGKAA